MRIMGKRAPATAVLAVAPGSSTFLTESPLNALVLDAHLRQSLVTVRSIGRRGLRAGALDTRPDAPAFSSRWCAHAFTVAADIGTARTPSF